MTRTRPFFILIVLDGFGTRPESDYNAIEAATTPTFDRLFAEEAWTTVEASGLHVGLPDKQMGNSEVGHLNIGAGRVVDQDIVRISKAATSGELAANETLMEELRALKERGKSLHLIGLLSGGGVHSLQEHLHGLIDAAIANGLHRGELPSIFIHAVLDGRDTPPRSAIEYLRALLAQIEGKADVTLSTVVGRFYAMDRDKRWDRVKRAYDLITRGAGAESRDVLASIEHFYDEAISDEFMEPIAMVDAKGLHHGNVEDGDAILFFNFRADRMRQIISAFSDPAFDGFERTVFPKTDILCLVRYHEDWTFPVVFPPQEIKGHLGEVLSAAGLKQLRIAETEKYAHVTFFFNGGSDEPSEGEERILIPSPQVKTYDLQPEMSVPELANRVVSEIESKKFDVIIMNIANPDMVGHTGVMEAAVRAVEATDKAVGQILDATAAVGGVAMITADHGNCELMFDRRIGQPHTAHTTYPVPLILVDSQKRFGTLRAGGSLENVAPTMLDVLGIERSPQMTADSLLVRS